MSGSTWIMMRWRNKTVTFESKLRIWSYWVAKLRIYARSVTGCRSRKRSVCLGKRCLGFSYRVWPKCRMKIFEEECRLSYQIPICLPIQILASIDHNINIYYHLCIKITNQTSICLHLLRIKLLNSKSWKKSLRIRIF